MKWDRDTEAFKRQNDTTWATLTKEQKLLICMDTEHHSGNLFVAGQRVNYDVGEEYLSTFYVKMHDTWGDPEDPKEGPVVVHLYDTEVSPQGDIVLYFTTGKAAADLYLNDEALVAIWKVANR